MIYYLLIVLSLSGAPMFEDPRLYIFEQCQAKRDMELAYYDLYENKQVIALCTPVYAKAHNLSIYD